MADEQFFFTDTTSATLEYTGDGDGEALFTDDEEADFDPSEAETITRDGPWTNFFDTDEFVQFEATVAQPIVQPYIYDGDVVHFRKDESELRRAQAQIDNLPWTMGHPPEKRVTNAGQIRGVWADPRYNDGQQANLNIPANDPEAVRFAVSNDDVSVGFGGVLDWADDQSDDDWDATQREMAYDHIASVENGRCPPEQGCGLHTDNAGHGHVTDAVQTKMTEEQAKGGAGESQLSEGDWVKWDWSGGTARGQVTNISTERTLSTSGTSRDPTEKGEPVYKIKHWDDEAGEWGNMKVAYQSNLRSASQPDGFTDAWRPSGCSAVCSPGPCSCGLHDPFTDVEVNGEDIDLVPPEAAQNAAQQALDARDDEDVEVNGMTEHGWSRAEQLASGEELSPSDIVGGTGAMAPWWSRHETHTIEGDSLAGSDKDNPWEDNSYTSGKGWGGMTGYRWAIRKGNEIKRARGEEPTYDTDDSMTVDAPDGLYVEDGTWYGIAPSETADDEPKYELDNCNDVKDAYNLRNNGDFEVSVDTLVTRIKRASESHDCPPEQKPWADSHPEAVLAQAIKQSSKL